LSEAGRALSSSTAALGTSACARGRRAHAGAIGPGARSAARGPRAALADPAEEVRWRPRMPRRAGLDPARPLPALIHRADRSRPDVRGGRGDRTPRVRRAPRCRSFSPRLGHRPEVRKAAWALGQTGPMRTRGPRP
jgi:hypothetical protein